MYDYSNQNKLESSLEPISPTSSIIWIVQRDFVVKTVENKLFLSGSVSYLEPFLGIAKQNKLKLLKSTNDNNQFSKENKTCSICQEKITDMFVEVMGMILHSECFKCYDCHKTLVSNFFLINDPKENEQRPLCETDYFRRSDLLCISCGKALQEMYIVALNKKYHINHFTCSICSTTFTPEDSYYCNGCRFIISKQFTEILRNGQKEYWHVGCYAIYKFWKVKLALQTKNLNDFLKSNFSSKHLLEQEKILKEKVYRIWEVLSRFERSFVACISSMLLHISNGNYIDEIISAKNFVEHVESLFLALDWLKFSFHEFNEKFILYNREVKLFFRKIVYFFSFLLTTWKLRIKRLGTTDKILSLTLGLSRYLKYLTKISLIGALQLEKDNINPTAVYDFLDYLDSLKLGVRLSNDFNNEEMSFKLLFSIEYNDITSNICMICQKNIKEKCVRIGNKRCHIYCLKCSKCNKDMEHEPRNARWNKTSKSILCLGCSTTDSEEFLQVTEFSQYIFLLRIILLQLYITFKDNSIVPHLFGTLSLETCNFFENQEDFSLTYNNFETRLSIDDKVYFKILKDAQNLYKFRLNSKLYNDDFEFFNVNGKITNINEKGKKRKSSVFQYQYLNNSLMESKFKIQSENISQISTPKPDKELIIDNSTETKTYLSSLSILETFVIKHIAILSIEPLVRGFFSLDELLDLVKPKKRGFFRKVTRTFRSTNDYKKKYKKKEVFGVPLEILVEENGVNSEHGMVPGRLYIPGFIDEIISAMKQMDVSVEGIFRKNGNIKRLNDFTESIDNNFNSLSFNDESPIQLAALMKKFLRELPEPLLTFKLHKLFLASQKIDDENTRYRALHLTCCLLPKCHLNCMEAIFLFLNWVASFANINKESGNKMDIYNLATVITPDILYSKNRKTRVDEAILAIKVVYTLIEFIDKFSLVPTDLLSTLHDLCMLIKNPDLNIKDMLKEYEKILEINSLKNAKLSPIKKFIRHNEYKVFRQKKRELI
ncbi:unnamed protein product [Pneumocystis jirovecii]|uniref:Rho-GAP domain-containing protein n=1 Tax=Pneumocystis jirovecii TaxID=42068 RepID=L0P7I5_PNEJI|nr:unnamed protein product [Pneumocystis jirovecii]